VCVYNIHVYVYVYLHLCLFFQSIRRSINLSSLSRTHTHTHTHEHTHTRTHTYTYIYTRALTHSHSPLFVEHQVSHKGGTYPRIARRNFLRPSKAPKTRWWSSLTSNRRTHSLARCSRPANTRELPCRARHHCKRPLPRYKCSCSRSAHRPLARWWHCGRPQEPHSTATKCSAS